MYERFEKLLEERNISAYRVAKETGIPQPVFSEWKRGKCRPKADKLLILAKYFQVSVEYFLETEPEIVQEQQEENKALLQAIWVMKGLDEYDIQRIIDFAAGIRANRKLAETG